LQVRSHKFATRGGVSDILATFFSHFRRSVARLTINSLNISKHNEKLQQNLDYVFLPAKRRRKKMYGSFSGAGVNPNNRLLCLWAW